MPEKNLSNKKKIDFLGIFSPFIVLVIIYIGLEIIIRMADIPRLVLPTPTDNIVLNQPMKARIIIVTIIKTYNIYPRRQVYVIKTDINPKENH